MNFISNCNNYCLNLTSVDNSFTLFNFWSNISIHELLNLSMRYKAYNLRLVKGVLNSKQKTCSFFKLVMNCKFSGAVLFWWNKRLLLFWLHSMKAATKFKVFCIHYFSKTKRKPVKKKTKQCISSKTKSTCQNSTTSEHFQKWPKNQGIVLDLSLSIGQWCIARQLVLLQGPEVKF